MWRNIMCVMAIMAKGNGAQLIQCQNNGNINNEMKENRKKKRNENQCQLTIIINNNESEMKYQWHGDQYNGQ